MKIIHFTLAEKNYLLLQQKTPAIRGFEQIIVESFIRKECCLYCCLHLEPAVVRKQIPPVFFSSQ